MALWSSLKQVLETVLGSTNVYFQPPASVTMKYPCIVFKRIGSSVRFANGRLYSNRICYQLTYIDRIPDSPTLDKLAELPLCEFIRHFTADNLSHDIYNIYY
jgi:hypothetical protein